MKRNIALSVGWGLIGVAAIAVVASGVRFALALSPLQACAVLFVGLVIAGTAGKWS